MKADPVSYRRREDGVLELLRPAGRHDDAVRGTEIAVAVVALVIGTCAAGTGNPTLGAVLLLAGLGVMLSRLLRDRLAARARRRSPPVLPTSDDRTGHRVIRLEGHASVTARAPGTPVRLPGSAASPQE